MVVYYFIIIQLAMVHHSVIVREVQEENVLRVCMCLSRSPLLCEGVFLLRGSDYPDYPD